MAPIKLFRAVQSYFDELGFYAPSQPNQRCQFNRKNSFNFCAVTGMCISVTGFFFFEADSAYEYSDSFYIALAMFILIVYFTIFLYKLGASSKLIENYEEFIEKR